MGGYNVAPTLGAVYCKAALEMALKKIKKRTAKALIHHSDRDLQYCSAIYIGLLDNYHVQISMTETGDPLENPIAEQINGILKNEYLAHRSDCSLAQAELVLEQSVFLYNYKRPHMNGPP
ncbi:hypothetical protein GCM10028805_52470 [Spirosoma harenae]